MEDKIDWSIVFSRIVLGSLFFSFVIGSIYVIYDESNAQYNWGLYDKVFEKCMSTHPKGPSTVHYNDWEEIYDKLHKNCTEKAKKRSRLN